MGEQLDPRELGITDEDLQRARIIAETDEMRQVARETGQTRHLPQIDAVEEAALRAVEQSRIVKPQKIEE